MDAKRNANDPIALFPCCAEQTPLSSITTMLHGLREFYESGEREDDEENEVELMIQLSGTLYNNTENNE